MLHDLEAAAVRRRKKAELKVAETEMFSFFSRTSEGQRLVDALEIKPERLGPKVSGHEKRFMDRVKKHVKPVGARQEG